MAGSSFEDVLLGAGAVIGGYWLLSHFRPKTAKSLVHTLNGSPAAPAASASAASSASTAAPAQVAPAASPASCTPVNPDGSLAASAYGLPAELGGAQPGQVYNSNDWVEPPTPSGNNLARWLVVLPHPVCISINGGGVTVQSVYVNYDNIAAAFKALHGGQWPQRTWSCDGSSGAGANNCTQVDAGHWVQQYAAAKGLVITGPY